MSEKATLLTSIPPLLKETDPVVRTEEQTDIPASAKNPSLDTASDFGEGEVSMELIESAEMVSAVKQPVSDASTAASSSNGVVYGLIALVVCLCVVAVIIFVRKGSKGSTQENSKSDHGLNASVAGEGSDIAGASLSNQSDAGSNVESPQVAAKPAPAVVRTPKKLPPMSPVASSKEKLRAASSPKRPSVSKISEQPAPNVPSRVKAPSKPKKRF